MVSQGILYADRRSEFEDFVPIDLVKATQRILATSAEGRKRLRQMDTLWFKMKTLFWERWVIPGISLHYVMRKRFIEEIAVKAIHEGFTQVVNLGAGLDTLALRLHQQYPNVAFVEVDCPATSAEKAEAIARVLTQFGERSSNLHLLSADLSQQAAIEKLTELKSFDSNKKTFFICEGVLMYLKQEAVVNLLLDLRSLTVEKSKIIFTCVEPMRSKRNNTSWLLKLYLKFKGEPLGWFIEREDLPNFLAERGYKIQTLATFETFQDRYLKDYRFQGTLHRGEYIGVAQIL